MSIAGQVLPSNSIVMQTGKPTCRYRAPCAIALASALETACATCVHNINMPMLLQGIESYQHWLATTRPQVQASKRKNSFEAT